MAEGPPRSSATEVRRLRLAALGVAFAHVAALGWLITATPFTADEGGYVLAGHAILADWSWDTPQEVLHGPLALIPNQTWVRDLASAELVDLERVRTAARAGMLPFALLTLGVVWAWARAAWGERGAVLALVLAATNPALLAHGALAAADSAFAATMLLTCWLAWRWLREPGLARLLSWSAALGACLATKYTALLLSPCAPVLVALAATSRRRALTPGRAVLALVVAAVVALAVLHATYLFRAPLFQTGTPLQSTMLQRIAPLLQVLPAPFVAGVDYQASAARELTTRFLDYDHAHAAYYALALALRTPLAALVLFALGASAAWRARPRWLFACLLGPPAVLFAYMSLSDLQIGLRYVLPVLPPLCVLGGAWLADGRRLGRVAWLGTSALGALLVATTATALPHGLGYFNALVAGPAGGYRWFADSNCDWGQDAARGRDALASRYGASLEFLLPNAAPRLGRVAAYAPDLAPPDPERPGRTYHWARRFTPVDHFAAAWLVFEVAAEDFATAARRGDARATADLALAWLHEGDVAAARAALAAETTTVAERIRAFADVLGASTIDDRSVRRLAVDVFAAGNPALAADLLRAPATPAQLYLALWAAGDAPRALEVLRDTRRNRRLTTEEALLLAGGLLAMADFRAAAQVIEPVPPPAEDDPMRRIYDDLRGQIDAKRRAMQHLQGH